MVLEDNLIQVNSKNYLQYIKVEIVDDFKFNLILSKDLDDRTLYISLYSYIKNKQILIKTIYVIVKRQIGFEYINIINITNFSLYDFIVFRRQNLINDDGYIDSHFDFINNISYDLPLKIEITTFNKHNLTTNTKPKITT